MLICKKQIMKKIILLAFLITVSISKAQDKGTWVFGGELGFRNTNFNDNNSANLSDTNSEQLNIFARTGYIFKNSNFEVGLGLGYGSSKNNSLNFNGDRKFITTVIAPYIKKYFPINDKFAFHLIGEFGYRKSYVETPTSNNEVDMQEYGFVLRPGFVYFFTKNIALTGNIGSLGYLKNEDKYFNLEDSEYETFSFSLNSTNIMFGFAYYL